MGSSVTSLTDEILARLGNRQDLGARVLTWLNYAYTELILSPRFDFHENEQTATFPTVANQTEYLLDNVLVAEYWRIVDVRLEIDSVENRRILNQRHIKDFDRIFQTTGQPVRYYLWQNGSGEGVTMFLDPTPDLSTYNVQVRYKVRLSPLIDMDSLAIAREWDELLVVMSVIKGLQAFKLWDEAAAQKQYMEQLIITRMDVPVLEQDDAEFGMAVDYDGFRIPGGR